jgi:hypothetical protein
MTNCAIHGESSSILDYNKTTKASRSELLHGVGYRMNDQSNELVEPPFIATKD